MTYKNADLFLHHMMRMKQKQFLEAAGRQCFGGQNGPFPGFDMAGNMSMTETRVYIGLNDAETREQKYETGRYLDTLKDVCRNYRVPFSVDVEEGGYYHEDGEYTEENTLVLILIDAEKDIVQKIAKDICTLFHQESVLVTENRVEGYSVNQDA